MKRTLIILLAIIGLAACTEKMKIDTQVGAQLVGVSASITDEFKHHEVILSYTDDFYGGAPEMISNATVFVLDGADTIWFEESENNGYYLSVNEFAGQTGHSYHLSIDFSDKNGDHHFYSDTKMNVNVDKIDSIKVKPWVFNALEMKNYLGIYPYFQTTNDPKTYYMARIRINDELVGGDTLTKCELFEMYQYAGIYFNGPGMVAIGGEFPIYGLRQTDSLEVVHHGDTVTLDLWSIPRDYAHYIFEIASSTGTNPMMGTPSNVRTNIYPEGEAVGCFHASSLRQCSVIY
ncbi:MAG: DUF4249 family protein [Bacteroidales bacterium]|nr:DUF4249 family protein [Bacteroidales bacterium]